MDDEQLASAGYERRIGALELVWRRWAAVGAELSEAQWSQLTRCPEWDVAALYAHVGMFPAALIEPPPMPADSIGDMVTAVEILRGFNAAGGVADEMATQVAEAAIGTANARTRADLIAMYAE